MTGCVGRCNQRFFWEISRLKLIPTMTKECRKYGIALVVTSQEARDFDTSLFSSIGRLHLAIERRLCQAPGVNVPIIAESFFRRIGRWLV